MPKRPFADILDLHAGVGLGALLGAHHDAISSLIC